MSSPEPSGRAEIPLRRYLAALGVGVVLIVLAALLIRRTELVTGRYMSAGVPPILAVTGLLLLVGTRPLLERLHPALALDRRQALLVYAMLAVAVVACGQYVVRAFLPHLVTLQYWSARSAALRPFQQYLPAWLAPSDPAALRGYFEGARGEGVPWSAWAGPLGLWSLLFLALFVAVWSLLLLFERQWLRNERLSFPLLNQPLAVTAAGPGGIGSLFRRPAFWCGVGVAALFNGLNVLHAVYPTVPAPGFFYSFAGQFPDAPWTPLNTLMLFFMLEAIGFGYFVSLEVSFSAWFFYLLVKAIAVAGLAAGVESPGFPFVQEQSAGAYLGVTLLLVWGARRALLAPLRATDVAREEHRSERRAYLGLVVSLLLLGVWCWQAGLSLPVGAAFFGLLFCFVLVYARLRAETGVPFEFIYPYGLPKEMLINAWGARGILDAGGPRSWVMLSSLAWLSRHHFMEAMGAYGSDSLKLRDEAGLSRRRLFLAMLLALVVGLACAFWIHLDAYYMTGSNLAAGGAGQGEYRARVALQEYQLMATRAVAPPPRDTARLAALGIGLVVALGLGVLRGRLTRSPLHPLGFILATAYGDHTTIFFPMLLAWTIKALVLRIGGLPAYRAGIPLFLGLILGHFLIGGLLWPTFSLLLAPEAAQSYHLYFGG